MAASGKPGTSRGLGVALTMLLGVVLVIFGAPILGGGVWLIVLGGSWYYLFAGLGLLVTAWLLFRRSIAALWVYLLTFAGTLAWALWEAGLDGWAQVPRLVAPSVVLVLVVLTLPVLRGGRPRYRRTIAGVAAIAGLAATALLAARGDIVALAQQATGDDPDPPASAQPQAGADWPAYGGTHHATRFSSLEQITPANVGDLEQVWEFRTGDMPEADERFSNQNTPLKIGDRLLVCSAMNQVIALDAATGLELWRHDPGVSPDAIPYNATCRGLAYYAAPDLSQDDPCAERVLMNTLDARLLAVDVRTGQLCEGFGDGGSVDLEEGIGRTVPGWYAPTSPPTIVRDVAVVHSQVRDGQRRDAPSGVVRGYDAASGEMLWAWDMGRPGEIGPPAEGETYTRGTPNVWTIASGDDELGLVYLPHGNSAVDYWGGDRSDAENEYSTALVALDVETGEVAWHYQTVRYDIWDYDLGSQGTLIDFPTPDGPVPALVLPTKQSMFWIFDRRTGELLVEVEDRPVPQGGVEPDRLSPTQPFVVDFPNLLKPDLEERHMWGMTPLDQLFCRIQYRQSRYEGIYTPPSTDWWIQFPGYNGGSDWGGVAVDPGRGIMVANYNITANRTRLVPREQVDEYGVVPIDEPGWADNSPEDVSPQADTPYGIEVNAGWRVPFTQLLCTQPPYGGIMAVDLQTREVLWDKPFGTARGDGPWGIPSGLPFTIGTPNNGGAVVTASGLIFIAATTDNLIRAIDIETGEELWRDTLPAGGQAGPAVYEVEGRQYLVINAGGHTFMETPIGDHFIAWALPDGT
ncbi:membrane-bound PQQ-dependent dehydrogenase, glucose/quinate/shikimate family [Paracoccus siganidrum]|uniref:Membrane-bound PQQ-dependent dehydrogenase, glucose/quinate/shikimate family n=1 Tax=Paracoccus siganidrum TaxID=1276757 RepID=A0A419AC17_9RHOB|nr:membrane-bound PQQ-dependent dehydrogenase, glucose/quinate/shikimate family [Paracoccus siganidrum]RJL21533.1 membrane-bound PQQ-dependent dehydrogenase, glucose/quinate/shikimate family [Paracoccus siganidrum]RMC30928.1 membrane-bound PQQ-dependent dehydrogenase, glucose/quinate/shikimate family [Paracoccus siganidrum]